MPASKRKTAASKKTTVRKPAAKKTAAKKTAAKKVTSKKKTVSKKKPAAAVKAPSRKKVAAKKTAAKKPAAKKTVSKKKAPAAKKTASKKKVPAAKKTVSKKKAPAAKKTVSKKKAPGKKEAAASKKKVAPKKAPARKAPAAKAASKKKATPAKRKARAALLVQEPTPQAFSFSGPLASFKPYEPKRSEDYMSDAMLDHFRRILLAWKQELMEEVDRTVHHMKDEAANFPDPNDRATQESEFGLELRTRDRERKLLKKIEEALKRIEDGTYGYCLETGEEIGLRRLEARPVATLTVEAQERRELAEKQYRDRDER